jgi:hypothetical protein
MMFREQPSPVLAISQPSHAWIAGQILRGWGQELEEPLLLAADQHDIAWLDWERAPSFNPDTGRPHAFRALGPATHAPMWAEGIQRALSAWGMRVALLVSRHGALLYTRFADPARISAADAVAIETFLREQRPLQARWAEALGLDEATLAHDTELLALVDALSLAMCGDLKTPREKRGLSRFHPGPCAYLPCCWKPRPFHCRPPGASPMPPRCSTGTLARRGCRSGSGWTRSEAPAGNEFPSAFQGPRGLNGQPPGTCTPAQPVGGAGNACWKREGAERGRVLEYAGFSRGILNSPPDPHFFLFIQFSSAGGIRSPQGPGRPLGTSGAAKDSKKKEGFQGSSLP